jgi:Fe-S-cluster-containing hydrogenase component 2
MMAKISIAPKNCSGCLRCALACSYLTSPRREFNLSKSRITVLPGWEQGEFEITLSEECTSCGICVMYCEFGVLSQSKETQHG